VCTDASEVRITAVLRGAEDDGEGGSRAHGDSREGAPYDSVPDVIGT
jgi:hypothetical protein